MADELDDARIERLMLSGGLMTVDAALLAAPLDPQLGDACVRLHGAGRVDVLSLVGGPAYLASEWPRRHAVQKFVASLLPRLSSSLDAVLDYMDHSAELDGGETSAPAMIAWAAARPEQARELVDRADAGDDRAARYLGPALIGLADLATTRALAERHDDPRRASALSALGASAHADADERDASFACLATLLAASDDAWRPAVLHATLAIQARGGPPWSERARVLVRAAAGSSGAATLRAVADALWRYPALLDDELVAVLLEALLRVDGSDPTTISSLDLGLQSAVQRGFADRAGAFVSRLLSDPAKPLAMTDLALFGHALLQASPEVLGRVVAAWLLEGRRETCLGLGTLLARRDEPRLGGIDLGSTGLSGRQIAFACRKAVGYLFQAPLTASSFLLSALRVLPEPEADEVARLLRDPLATSYASVLDLLRAAASEVPADARLAEVVRHSEDYLAGLGAAGRVRELEPSEHRRQLARRRVVDEVGRSYRAATARSPILASVTFSTLLHGSSALSYLPDPEGPGRPVETTMREHGVSHELPRAMVFDAVGLELQLFRLQVEKAAP